MFVWKKQAHYSLPLWCLLCYNTPSGAVGMTCRNMCLRAGITGHNGSLYEKGFKYCTRCAIYIKTEATRCTCCGNVYKIRSRGHAPSRCSQCNRRRRFRSRYEVPLPRLGSVFDQRHRLQNTACPKRSSQLFQLNRVHLAEPQAHDSISHALERNRSDKSDLCMIHLYRA